MQIAVAAMEAAAAGIAAWAVAAGIAVVEMQIEVGTVAAGSEVVVGIAAAVEAAAGTAAAAALVVAVPGRKGPAVHRYCRS